MRRNMNRHHPLSLRSVALGLTLVWMAGCGGGGGEPGTPSATSRSAYREAVWVHDGSQSRWLVHDPLLADDRFTLGSGSTAEASARSPAVRVDATSGQVTPLGDHWLFYLQGGQLFGVNLRGDIARPTAVPLSSAGALCGIEAVVPLQADGALAVVAVRQRVEVSRPCDDPAASPDRTLLIRTDMAATASAVDAGQERLLTGLGSPDGQVSQLLLARPDPAGAGERLVQRSPAELALPSVLTPSTPAAGQPARFLGVDPLQSGMGYVLQGGGIRVLSWSDRLAQVGTDVLAPAGGLSLAQVGADDGLYVAADEAVYKLAAGAATRLGTVVLEDTLGSITIRSRVDSLHVAQAQVLVLTRGSGVGVAGGSISNHDQVQVLPRAGGGTQVVATATSGDFQPAVSSLSVLGHSESEFWVVRVFCASLGCTRSFEPVSASTGNMGSRSGQAAGVLLAASHPPGQPARVTDLLVCLSDCTSSPLLQQPLEGGASTALGLIGARTLTGFITAPSGRSVGFSTRSGALQVDAWQFSPGQAGSLLRLTGNPS